jgi:hypothetical protein
MKANKKKIKTKPKLTHRIDVKVRLGFFYGSSLHTYLVTALICHFGTFLQCAQQPSGTFLCGFYVAFNMLKLVGDIPIMKKAAVSIYCSASCLCSYSPFDFRN